MSFTTDRRAVIKFTNLRKEYRLHHEKPTLVEKFIKGCDERFVALDNINLEITRGEHVGVVGPNGSGKTTLLKIISGISSPTSGDVWTKGRIVSLIDLAAGFHPDLNGYQNIFLNGMLIGMGRGMIEKLIGKIIAFADIKQFIDAPLYTYSSGMRLRLGFSIAVHSSPDILVLDEGLNVGDKYFQEKAKNKIKELFTKNITLIVVSHDLDFLRQYCRRVILLVNGKIVKDGGLRVLNTYEKSKT